jgi:UDP-glucose:(heptosyl)LPS alpha-1,3-glucosyltransferase
LRATLGLAENDWVWIGICVQPTTKGLDRTVRALQSFPHARLLVVGLEAAEHKSVPINRLARELKVSQRITWVGHSEHVPELMAAADLFVHPARNDTTGTVILESIVNGLPVVTMAYCGYARHVSAADAGIVLQPPFNHAAFLEALHAAGQWSCASRWSLSASRYGERDELYTGRRRAAEFIVAAAGEKVTHRSARRHSSMLPVSSVPL